jgi:hypothetical protein
MRILVLLFAALPLFAQNFVNAKVTRIDAATRGAGAAVGNASGWFAWTVPTAGVSICCSWEGNGGSCCGRCSLEGNRGFSINRPEADEPRPRGEALLVMRVANGAVKRVRLYSATCEIEGQGNAITLLTNVTPESSIDYLVSRMRDADDEGELMAALSMHHHARVVPELINLARNDPNREVRRHAIFWLGQKAGDKAAAELRRTVDQDPDVDLKEHAVFAISQLPRERSVPLLMDLAKTHKNAAVRKKAMFWLAQTGDQRAIDLLEQILLP